MATSRMVYIYGLKHPLTGRIYYVGKSTNPARRLFDHKNGGGTAVAKWIRELGQLPDIVIYAAEPLKKPHLHAKHERERIIRLDASGEPLLNIQHVPGNQRAARRAGCRTRLSP